MKIELVRDNIISNSQFGKLYIDNVHQCETLENASTLIPCDNFKLGFRTSGGWYNMEKEKLGYKDQFKGMIEIQVKGREYILLHPANSPNELKGCIAPAKTRDEEKGCLGVSRPTYYKLYSRLIEALKHNEPLTLQVTKKGEKKMLSKFLGSGASDLVKSVGGVLDSLTTTSEEKLEAERKIKELILDHDAKTQKNVTDRWQSDMKSDSWLSKNIRPMVVIFIYVATVLLIFIDSGSIKFNVKPAWVDMLQLVLTVVTGAYFGGRSVEKIKR
jgi:hypothetical protein